MWGGGKRGGEEIREGEERRGELRYQIEAQMSHDSYCT